MKLHFVSRGYAVGLAYQAQRDSCSVMAHMPDCKCGEGMFPRVPNARPAGDCDAVILDGPGWGKVAAEMSNEGRRVLFGGAWAELVCLKPEYNRKLLAKAGLPQAVGAFAQLPYRLIVGGWFEDGFGPPYYAAVLRTRLLGGDVGAECGLVAAEVMPLDEESDLVDGMLSQFGAAIEGVPYRGLLGLSVVPSAKGLAVTHVVAGIQPLVIEALAEMQPDGLRGLLARSGAESTDCAVALALSLPPWPYGIAAHDPPVRLTLDSGQAKHFWPSDVAQDGDALRYTGGFGVIGTVTARGKPRTDAGDHSWFDQAGYRARTMVPRLSIADLQYRTDIGYHTERALEPLAIQAS